MNFELPEDYVAIRDVTRAFAAEQIAPRARKWDDEKWIPTDLFKEMGRVGILGVSFPDEYGGAGLGLLGMTVVVEEIARWCGASALFIAAHSGLCSTHIRLAANDEQKRHWLPKLATGDAIGAWCLSEPHCGTDAEALTTRAEQNSKGWVLNGAKFWITNALRADVFVVTARTKGAERGARTISAFLVEKNTPGLILGEPEDKMGMRGSDTVPVNFENCQIPAENLCGELHHGYIDALRVLDRGRCTIGALSVGLARGCLEEAVKYSAERHSMGVPLNRHQAIQFKLADMETQIEAARLLVRQAAVTHDAGRPDKELSSIAKLFASEMASRVGWDSIQIHGGAGYTKDVCVERLVRDNKLCEIGEGSSEVQRMLIARAEYARQSA
ncbi:MAG TPA: acyl-CoA dehydrogenase family protein [Phycisphaerae bacterium]|nr:acyl-CoA dehydrogenase family protein [Phycisphaerae bacterium]